MTGLTNACFMIITNQKLCKMASGAHGVNLFHRESKFRHKLCQFRYHFSKFTHPLRKVRCMYCLDQFSCIYPFEVHTHCVGGYSCLYSLGQFSCMSIWNLHTLCWRICSYLYCLGQFSCTSIWNAHSQCGRLTLCLYMRGLYSNSDSPYPAKLAFMLQVKWFS